MRPWEEFRGHSELEKARNYMKKAVSPKEGDKEEQKAEALKTKKRKNEQDELLKQVDREVRGKLSEEEKKAENYKEADKLAKKVAESREVLQASWRDGDKLPEYLSSK